MLPCCHEHRGDGAQPERRSQGRLGNPLHRAQNDLRRLIRLRRRVSDRLVLLSGNGSVLRIKVQTAFDEWDEVLRATARREVPVANELLIEPGRACISGDA